MSQLRRPKFNLDLVAARARASGLSYESYCALIGRRGGKMAAVRKQRKQRKEQEQAEQEAAAQHMRESRPDLY